MRAIRFDGKKLKEVRIPKPRTRRGEALVRVHLAGICATDLEITRGYMGFTGVPGHEFVGTVHSAQKKNLIGKRVVGEINVPCGKCSLCRRGLEKHCTHRSVLGISRRHGAFAEYLTLPVGNLHPVPRTIGDEEAVMTEPLAAACEIPVRVAIPAGCKAAVLGDGRLAALVAQVLGLRTKNVDVLGINPHKLAVIRRLGIRTHLLSHAKPTTGRTGHISIPSRFRRRHDVVVECSGRPEGLPLATELVRPQGTVILKSTYQSEMKWNPTSVAVDEITIVGSRCGPFEMALRLIAMGSVEVRPFITATYPIDRWREAFRRARHPDSFKVLIRIGDRS
ncbi:MAG: alcohol dehydrogenase catalytic domain-containing protein [bacterium]|nr:MAG: alcohol dehydrogenase catalytic domain-containing protein [bacterium]